MAEARRPGRGTLWVYPHAEDLAAATAERMATCLRDAVSARGRASLVLAGGTTPVRTYDHLAARSDVPWTDIDVFFGDERDVPPTDPESNYRMVEERLLARAGLAADRVHRIEAERGPQEAAERYEDTIRSALGLDADGWPRFDLVLLGLGADGHTASLFPGSEALVEHRRIVSAPWVARLKGRRVTLTPPAINAAAQVWFLVTGAGKARVLATAVRPPGPGPSLPVHAVAPSGELLWLADAAAAGA